MDLRGNQMGMADVLALVFRLVGGSFEDVCVSVAEMARRLAGKTAAQVQAALANGSVRWATPAEIPDQTVREWYTHFAERVEENAPQGNWGAIAWTLCGIGLNDPVFALCEVLADPDPDEGDWLLAGHQPGLLALVRGILAHGATLANISEAQGRQKLWRALLGMHSPRCKDPCLVPEAWAQWKPFVKAALVDTPWVD